MAADPVLGLPRRAGPTPVTVDFHAHLARPDPEAPSFLRHLFDVDGYLERQEAAGIELAVLSYAPQDLEGTGAELDRAKAEHEFLGDLVSRYPGRFVALAGVDPFGGNAWLEEAERALDSGFAGLCLPTSRQGRYLDSPDAGEALALADERGVVVFLHPSESAIDMERAGDPTLEAWIGLPCDTGVCLSRMLLADTLSRYRNVRLVAAHSGGALPMLLGRLDYVADGLKRRAALFAGGGPPGGPPGGGPPDGPPGGGSPKGPPGGGPPKKGPPGGGIPEEFALKPVLEGQRPSERVDQLYFDTAGYHPAAIRAAIAVAGIDRVVLGTDYPPAGESPQPSIDLVNGMSLAPDEREKILSGNARALLGR